MLDIVQAQPSDFKTVRNFYFSLIEEMRDSAFLPGWQAEVYPTSDEICRAIDNGWLYMGMLDGEMAAGMVVNNLPTDGYEQVKWIVDAEFGEASVVHLLGVHPRFARRGFAKEMARGAVELARKAGKKSVRLDVLSGNIPASRAYESVGFQHLETIPLYYADTGWADFLMYEYPLV